MSNTTMEFKQYENITLPNRRVAKFLSKLSEILLPSGGILMFCSVLAFFAVMVTNMTPRYYSTEVEMMEGERSLYTTLVLCGTGVFVGIAAMVVAMLKRVEDFELKYEVYFERVHDGQIVKKFNLDDSAPWILIVEGYTLANEFRQHGQLVSAKRWHASEVGDHVTFDLPAGV